MASWQCATIRLVLSRGGWVKGPIYLLKSGLILLEIYKPLDPNHQRFKIWSQI
ncbi:hypothetical protein PL9214500129 [Planktothrix tepida PCC 9214]|uniref:Uncharacterized protein n=1 Tax=Planktothrix tepida PCC 9214 TaxID=671072 RepID=A0A1J1LLG6_9CYAN|nr:hypothetical protein PL9214500129 [Planktothrix tepida PCC 9214]